MSLMFEELDFRPSPIGTLSLRRRRRASDAEDIYEIKLDEGYLMSSLFTAGEIALANYALEGFGDDEISVVVGGLGLGYTAKAALDHPRVTSLVIVEAIPEVVEWHQRGLLPLGAALSADCRSKFVVGSFFDMAAPSGCFERHDPTRHYDAILVDIDHSPRHLLHAKNATFYEISGLLAVADKLRPGGTFALWSTDPPDDDFLHRLAVAFAGVEARVVEFPNPYQDATATNTIYLARKAV
jgi:spermidine synthase